MKLITLALCAFIFSSSLIYSTSLKTTAKVKSTTLRNNYRDFEEEEIKTMLSQMKTGPYESIRKINDGRIGQFYEITKVNAKNPSLNEDFTFVIADYKENEALNSKKTHKFILNAFHFPKELIGNKHTTELLEFIDDKNDKVITMVLEKPKLTLFDCLENLECFEKKVENQEIKIVKSLLDGLSYMHKKMIAHLEINPKNIYINNDDTFKYKDSDNAMTLEEDQMETSYIGSTGYIDLNWLPTVAEEKQGLGLKSDIYSLGITILQIADRRLFLCLNTPGISDCSIGMPDFKDFFNSNFDIDFDKLKKLSYFKNKNRSSERHYFLTRFVFKNMLIPYYERKDAGELLELLNNYNLKSHEAGFIPKVTKHKKKIIREYEAESKPTEEM